MKRTHWQAFALGSCLLLLPAPLHALDPAKSVAQFNCQNWTRQNGLPVNGINAIAQTADGHIWLGTSKGLVRYDGAEFVLRGITNYSQFRNQVVSSLSASPKGGLWFGISYACFGYSDGQSLRLPESVNWLRRNMNVHVIQELRDGSVWVGAETGAGRFVEGDTNASVLLDSIGQVGAICEDARGRVWLGSLSRGLFCWQDGKLSAVGLEGEAIRSIAVDRQENVWVGITGGLRCFGADFRPKKIPALQHEVRALLVDTHGTLWIGSSGGGLITLKNGRFTFFQKENGLAHDYVIALCEDREGSLWVGTQDGLSQLTDLKLPVVSMTEGLNDTSSHAVSAGRDGGLWVTTSRGVTHFQGSQVNQYSSQNGLGHIYVKRAIEARNGDVYLINGAMAIEVLAQGRVVAVHTNSTWPVAMIEDASGVVASVGSNLVRVSRSPMTPFRYKGRAPELQWVYNLCLAQDGALWAATVNGIFRIKDGEWKHWSTAEGLSSYKVNCIVEDSDGAVWAGLATGLARIKDGQVRNISRNDGLFDDFIYAIVPDLHGYFWVDSVRGIFRVSRRSLNDFADGRAPQVECLGFDGMDAVKTIDKTDQEASGCRTADGRIWFPSPQGVIMVNPSNLFVNRVPPPVHIVRVRINGIEISKPGHTASPGGGNIEVRYKALSYIAPQKIRFRYRLEGHDRDWIEAGDSRSAFYSKVRPGKYTFQVQACNSDEVWSVAGDIVGIELPPYFYQTTWFKIIAVVLAFDLVAGAYMLRVRRFHRQQRQLRVTNEMLEAKVRERTQELSEQRNLLRTLIDNLPDEIFVKDTGSRVVIDNLAHARRMGVLQPADAVGKTDLDALPRAEAERFLADERHLLQTGAVYNGEERVLDPKGEVRWLRTTKVPLRDSDGTIVGLAGIARDITERKKAEAELQSLHQQLVVASREAGMAEVAISVLHNVGNVLNSVNVSAAIVEEKINSPIAHDLAKAVGLLRQYEQNPASLLAADGSGKKMVAYLEAFARHLAEEKAAIADEIKCLARNVEHIKEIVAMQQSYAKAAGVQEIVSPTVLVEDALHMNQADYEQQGIVIHRDFARVPDIIVDRHKVIQILVNLLKNARHACRDNAPVKGDVAVHVGMAGADRVKIEVADNGVGIPAENLTRIFAYGFTTRQGGHGYGLHSGALAAKEMGGSLLASSDGPGRGARFILELPLAQPASAGETDNSPA